jgi:hypothetical protein
MKKQLTKENKKFSNSSASHNSCLERQRVAELIKEENERWRKIIPYPLPLLPSEIKETKEKLKKSVKKNKNSEPKLKDIKANVLNALGFESTAKLKEFLVTFKKDLSLKLKASWITLQESLPELLKLKEKLNFKIKLAKVRQQNKDKKYYADILVAA